MEASAADPFAGTATAGDDPFKEGAVPAADIPPADVPVEEAAPPAEATGEEPRIVDKEGATVEQTGVTPNPHDPPAPPMSKAQREREADAASQAAQPEAEATPQPPVEPQEEPEPVEATPQPPTEPQEPSAPSPEPQDAPAGGEPPQQPPTAAGTDESSGGEEPDPAPATGKQTRLYKLLYQTGPTTWEETTIPDEYAETVEDKHGPQRFLKARNNDHARRLAFAIHERPSAGITIVPVPASSWKPRRVKAAPPAPDRERLVIE